MKRPEQRRRFKRKSLIEMSLEQLEAAAVTAAYAGSPEHKLPHARSDASLCPSELEGQQPQLTGWLRRAILDGQVGGCLEGKFPRYVWVTERGQHFEGRLSNHVLGEYHGYPITPEECPVAGPQNG